MYEEWRERDGFYVVRLDFGGRLVLLKTLAETYAAADAVAVAASAAAAASAAIDASAAAAARAAVDASGGALVNASAARKRKNRGAYVEEVLLEARKSELVDRVNTWLAAANAGAAIDAGAAAAARAAVDASGGALVDASAARKRKMRGAYAEEVLFEAEKLVPCPSCGRMFNAKALAKHVLRCTEDGEMEEHDIHESKKGELVPVAEEQLVKGMKVVAEEDDGDSHSMATVAFKSKKKTGQWLVVFEGTDEKVARRVDQLFIVPDDILEEAAARAAVDAGGGALADFTAARKRKNRGAYAEEVLLETRKSELIEDEGLHFEPTLTTAEREFVHSLAAARGLYSKSEGKEHGVDQHIVVRREGAGGERGEGGVVLEEEEEALNGLSGLSGMGETKLNEFRRWEGGKEEDGKEDDGKKDGKENGKEDDEKEDDEKDETEDDETEDDEKEDGKEDEDT